MRDEFQFTHYQVGLITSALLITYCIGQFINGWLGDKYGPRKIVSLGGFGSVLANLIFSAGTGLWHFIGLWGVNGYFSSMGWSPGCRLVYNWFPMKVRGMWIGIYNAFCYAGGAIVFPIAGFCALNWGWRSVFLIPPLFLLGMTAIFFFFVRNDPKEVGIEPRWRKEEEMEKALEREEKKRQQLTKVSLTKTRFYTSFTHRKMNLAYTAVFLSNFIRYALLIWVPMYLFEVTGMNIFVAATIATAINIGAATFSVVLGVISDRVFKGERWQTISAGFLFGAISISIFAMAPTTLVLLVVLLFFAGGLIQGIQTPLFNLPGDILGRTNASTGSGIMDGWAYAGAILTGFGMGYLIDMFGYLPSFYLMAIMAVFGALIVLPLRKKKIKSLKR